LFCGKGGSNLRALCGLIEESQAAAKMTKNCGRFEPENFLSLREESQGEQPRMVGGLRMVGGSWV